jgi:hypothetical protein
MNFPIGVVLVYDFVNFDQLVLLEPEANIIIVVMTVLLTPYI